MGAQKSIFTIPYNLSDTVLWQISSFFTLGKMDAGTMQANECAYP